MQKKIIMALLAVGIVAVAYHEAYAKCPLGTRYDCITTFNGKQSCGCR